MCGQVYDFLTSGNDTLKAWIVHDLCSLRHSVVAVIYKDQMPDGWQELSDSSPQVELLKDILDVLSSPSVINYDALRKFTEAASSCGEVRSNAMAMNYLN